jgi:receptor expression-enhancing protein 1/2/3/4
MFDIFPKFLSSIASFLFPLFASYKALKTSDPAQLTPWLMYWSVLSCALLVESWLEFILMWVPFYAYMRLFFLLYLVLPQTQGARHLYETYLHPYLEENESQIEEFIASAHDRLKAAGIAYLKQAIELLRTRVLGMPPSADSEEQRRQDNVRAKEAPQSYTQALLARFNVPAATRSWSTSGGASAVGSVGQDFYNLLAGAVSAATGVSALGSAGAGAYGTASSSKTGGARDMTASGTLIPDNIRGADEKQSFITSQKEKLAFLLTALDREARELEKSEEERKAAEASRKDLRPTSMSLDGGEDAADRPASGQSMQSGLSKSRSEVDFVRIEAESGAEDNARQGVDRTSSGSAKAWNFLGWGSTTAETPAPDEPEK